MLYDGKNREVHVDNDDIYGEGYEEAIDDGPDVEYIFKNKLLYDSSDAGWSKRYSDAIYFRDSKINLIKVFNEKGAELTKDKYNNFHEYCYYRQPVKSWKQSKEDVMQKSILDLKLEIENLKKDAVHKSHILMMKVVKLEKELGESKKKESPDNARILRDLITKYFPYYVTSRKDRPEFDVKELGDNKKRISVKYPAMNTEWTFAIMKATQEFCNEVKPGSIVIFGDNRLMTIQVK